MASQRPGYASEGSSATKPRLRGCTEGPRLGSLLTRQRPWAGSEMEGGPGREREARLAGELTVARFRLLQMRK